MLLGSFKVKKSIYGYTWDAKSKDTWDATYSRGNWHISLFFIFPFISVLIFVEKSMTVLLPNKSVSGHIFQKKNEHVSMLFWQSRVPTCLFGSNMLVVFFCCFAQQHSYLANTFIWQSRVLGHLYAQGISTTSSQVLRVYINIAELQHR